MPVTAAELAAVRRLCEGWNTMSQADFRATVTADCEYRNIPFDDDLHIGPDAMHRTLEGFGRKWDVRLEVLHLVEGDGVVLTERHEHFTHRAGEKSPFVLPVMGIFEVRDGLVSAWRDYFERSHMRLR